MEATMKIPVNFNLESKSDKVVSKCNGKSTKNNKTNSKFASKENKFKTALDRLAKYGVLKNSIALRENKSNLDAMNITDASYITNMTDTACVEDVSITLKEILQKLKEGSIGSEEFVDKILNEPKLLDELSKEISSDILTLFNSIFLSQYQSIKDVPDSNFSSNNSEIHVESQAASNNDLEDKNYNFLKSLLSNGISYKAYNDLGTLNSNSDVNMKDESSNLSISDNLNANLQNLLTGSEESQLKFNLTEDVKSIIQEFFKEASKDSYEENTFKNLEDALSKKIASELENSKLIGTSSDTLVEKSADTAFKEQIINALKTRFIELKSNDSLTNGNFYNDQSKNINNEIFTVKSNITMQNDSNENDNKEFLSKDGSEENFLKEVAADGKDEVDTKLNGVLNFTSRYNLVNKTNAAEELKDNISINKNTFADDIIKSIKYIESNDINEMTVKIEPKELGEVVIKLTVQHGLMEANITAKNKETYNLLNSNLPELNSKLENAEIKIQNFTVNIYNEDTTFFSQEDSKRRNREFSNKSGKILVHDIENIEDTSDPYIVEESNINAFV